MNNIFTKICGLTDEYSVETAVRSGAAYLGFVFFDKSPRNISPAKAAEISRNAPRAVVKVAVVVNPTNNEIENILQNFKADYLQLHGNESPERVDEIKLKFGIPVIKAFQVSTSDDVKKSSKYDEVANLFLFDAKPSKNGLPGGNGISFDWKILKARQFEIPCFISGGLNADNVKQAVAISGMRMVDVSSGVEKSPGVKDPILIGKFLKIVAEI